MARDPGRKRVLVTGGAGFIGSHLCELLVRRGLALTVVDDLSTGTLANLESAKAAGDVEFIGQRVGDTVPGLDAREFSAIYHLAAAVGVQLVLEKTAEAIERNVLDSIHLLNLASAAKCPVFIASSSEVYGRGIRSPFSEDDDVVYGATACSRWSYACSKAIDEYLALAHHRERGMPCVIGRFFNTVGPRQTGRYGMVLPRFVRAAIAGEPLLVHGDGQQSRCFCDVRDVVPAVLKLMEHVPANGSVFNIGSDKPIAILALARKVVAHLKSRSEVRLIPYDEVFGANFEDLRARQPNLSRIQAAIQFEPKISLESSIDDIASQCNSIESGTAR